MRVVPVDLGRLDQTYHRRRPLAAAQRTRKQPIVPANRDRPNLVFDPIVVHRQLTVSQEPCQSYPAAQAVVDRHLGTPQGGPLSPLLANVLLDEVDKALEARSCCFAGYADDCNV